MVQSMAEQRLLEVSKQQPKCDQFTDLIQALAYLKDNTPKGEKF
jgi:hypothetical protein